VDPFAPRRTVSPSAISDLLGEWRRADAPQIVSLATALRAAIWDGRVEAGVRIPAERRLAAELGVGRTTARRAYAALEEEGLIERRRGSGAVTAVPTHVDQASLPVRALSGHDMLDLAFAAPLDAAPQVREAMLDAAAALDLGCSGYFPAGLPELRRALARRFRAEGVPTDPEQVLVTAGAQHGIQLVLRATVAGGDVVLVERPTYPLLLEALRASRPHRDRGHRCRRMGYGRHHQDDPPTSTSADLPRSGRTRPDRPDHAGGNAPRDRRSGDERRWPPADGRDDA
jgi:hypothetical protein